MSIIYSKLMIMQCDVHIESQAARLGSVDLNK